jgi:hypothetical protein
MGCLLVASAAWAQRSPFGLGLQAGVSHSGWNLALVGQYHFSEFSAYLGPSVSLNRGLPGRGPVGLDAGMNWHLPSQRDWLGSVVNLDYQFNLWPEKTHLHELHLSYGLEFKIGPAFSLVQSMGVGTYVESADNNGDRKTFTGYGGLLRLRAGYRF